MIYDHGTHSYIHIPSVYVKVYFSFYYTYHSMICILYFVSLIMMYRHHTTSLTIALTSFQLFFLLRSAITV